MTVIRFPAGRAPRGTRPPRTAQPAVPEPTLAEICADLEPARIIQARQLHGWSRRDLADRCGVPAGHPVRWECGALPVHPLHLAKLAEVTGFPPAFFRRGRPMARLTAADIHFCS